MKKSDFCKRCRIHLGKSQFNKFACTACKMRKDSYYPSAFIKAKKVEKCCGNCADSINFAEQYFDGSPVVEPRLSEIRKKCCCGSLSSVPEKWKTDGTKCRRFIPNRK